MNYIIKLGEKYFSRDTTSGLTFYADKATKFKNEGSAEYFAQKLKTKFKIVTITKEIKC